MPGADRHKQSSPQNFAISLKHFQTRGFLQEATLLMLRSRSRWDGHSSPRSPWSDPSTTTVPLPPDQSASNHRPRARRDPPLISSIRSLLGTASASSRAGSSHIRHRSGLDGRFQSTGFNPLVDCVRTRHSSRSLLAALRWAELAPRRGMRFPNAHHCWTLLWNPENFSASRHPTGRRFSSFKHRKQSSSPFRHQRSNRTTQPEGQTSAARPLGFRLLGLRITGTSGHPFGRRC